ncbi:MICAL-like protein 2a isoform 2-T2 [Pholidichthys leucotaenia]
MAAIRALEQWCKAQCDGYRDVSITNMTTSFRNGLAFCALIHKYRPDLIDYDALRKEDVFENNRLAFRVAEEKLGIPALLDAEDMVALRIPDRLSILTYVSQYYNYFKGRPPMGGVKRPAEGSKEEPSEKKNLPVVASIFAPKTTKMPAEKTSTKVGKADPQVLPENANNKIETLSSKCAACKSHVHLVQRHFVEGKLYHRSCFRCSECSSILHIGGYKSGRNPDTFICNNHHNTSKPSPAPPPEAPIRNGPATSAAQPNGGTTPQPEPRLSSSVLSAPLNVPLKLPHPTPPPSQAWTASAQKTQAARRQFFQAEPPAVDASMAGNWKKAEPTRVLAWPQIEKNKVRVTGKKQVEENCNNNNKRPFTIRSADKRVDDDPGLAHYSALNTYKCSRGPAVDVAGWPSISQTYSKEPEPIDSNTRHMAVHKTTKDSFHYECRTNVKPVQTEPGRDSTEPDNSVENSPPDFTSVPTSDIDATRPSSGPPPAVPTADFGLNHPAEFWEFASHKPLCASENLCVLRKPQENFSAISANLESKYGNRSPMKSPSRLPAVKSISSSTSAPANHQNPSAKKGKYLSPTNASRTEMRSPSVKSYHVPAEQIERELSEIEASLARLEKEGVELEKKLRSCEEEGEGDILMDPLMVDWFNLIRKKQMYIRKESELVYIARTQDLEQQQPGVEWELRRLLEKPDDSKSKEEQQREKKLMQQLMEIVNGRNAIVDSLDEDRLREVEEDQQLNKMMQNLGVKKVKNKRKSSISKVFRRRSKRRVE